MRTLTSNNNLNYQITLQTHVFEFMSLLFLKGFTNPNTELIIICSKQDGPKAFVEIMLPAIQDLSL